MQDKLLNALKKLPYKRILIYIALYFAIILYTFPSAWIPIDRGLDNSHFYAFNHLFASDMQAGRDLVFTKGPLGFLLATQPIAKNMETAFIINFAVYSFFIIGALVFIGLYHKGGGITGQAALVIITILFLIIFNRIGRIEFLYSIIVYLYLYLYDAAKNKNYLILASLFAAFAALVKQSCGVFGILALLSYFALNAGKKGMLRGFALSMAVSFFGFLAMWLIIYGNMHGAFTYLQSAVYFSSGHTAGMVLEEEYNRVIIAAGIILWILGLYFINNKAAAISLLMLLIPFLSVVKYVFGREDAYHYLALVLFLIIMLYFSLLHINKLKQIFIYSAFGIVSIALVFTNIAGTEYGKSAKSRIFKNFFIPDGYAKIFGFPEYKNSMVYISSVKLEQSKLPEEIRNIIGKHTVDSYPVETSYVPANFLNWKPHPVFQSYIAYLPWLEKKNLEFYSKDSIPEYLIFENAGGQCLTIDNGYVFNDEPRTIMKILERYEPVSYYESRIIMQKKENPAKWVSEKTPPAEVPFGEWIEIPQERGAVITASVGLKKTFYGNIKKFFYREPKLLISYRANCGEIYLHNLPAGNIKNGVWISPYVTDPAISLIKAKKSDAPYGLKKNSLIKTDIHLCDEGCEIALYGQADFTGDSGVPSEKFAVFENSSAKYEFRLENTPAESNNPEKNSFYFVFDRHLLPEGDYSAGIRIKSDSRNETALITDKKLHVDKHKDYIHGAYVTAIKLDAKDPNFYRKKYSIQWINYKR